MIEQISYRLKKEDIDMSMPLLDRLLISRDITPSQLEGKYEDMYDPYLINDMEIAILRIVKAIKNHEHVLIYGDYDCDGITATVTMLKGLRRVGLNVDYYIPKRLIDGYGMNMNSIYDIMADDYSLVITVDCGITGFEEIKTLQENGIDVIVTDHHECKNEIPNALAVLDNKRIDNEYPFIEICGAAMAYKVIAALYEELGIKGEEKDLLIYTAMGTVADVMPLIDENRIIVKEGIKLIKESEKPSIKNLIRVAGKTETLDSLTASDIAFYIGPLINASSRVGDITYAIDLLMTDDENIAIECANKLQYFNNQRKEIESKIKDEAFNQIILNYDFNTFSPIVVYGHNWHKGVIGIVASRIVETFNRPAIILSKMDNENDFQGSCRTYKDIDMMQLLKSAEGYIKRYGGHKGAAGLTIEEKNIEGFINTLKKYAANNYNMEMFIPEIIIDNEIKPEELTIENVEMLKKLEPFGEKNNEPIFICKNLKTKIIKKIGAKSGSEQAHLRISFSIPGDNLSNINGIGFFKGEFADLLPSGKNVDVIFQLRDNIWKNKKSVQLFIKDIIYEPTYKNGVTVEEDSLYVDGVITIPDLMEEYGLAEDELLPNKDEYISVFKAINKIMEQPRNNLIITSINYLAPIISSMISKEINPFKLSRILEVLGDSNNITFKRMLFDNILITKELEGKEKIRLTQTEKYKKNHNY